MTRQKPRFKRSPKSTEEEINTGDQDLTNFASQAEVAPVEEEQVREAYPWENVSSKEKKLISLYLPKDVAEKLRYLSEETDIPQQKIMRKVVVPEIERQINELLKQHGE